MALTELPEMRVAALVPVLDASASAMVAMDADGRIVHVNDNVLELFGYAADELLGRPVEQLMTAEAGERHPGHRSRYLVDPRPRGMGTGMELVVRRKDRTRFPVEISLTPIRTDRGLWVVCGISDATPRRAFQTLARMNQVILRSADAAELYAQTCRVAVEEGGYLGASVGVPGPDDSVVMVAKAGSIDEYIDRAEISMDATDPRGRGPTGRALREGRSQYVDDFATDPTMQPWRELAGSFGIRASATLPLTCQGRTVAALSLWADHPRVFDAQRRTQLESLADNVSFALDGFDSAARVARLARHRAVLLQRLVAAQDEERAEIAAGLHDDPVQSLAAVDLRLGELRRRAAADAPALVPPVEQVQAIVEDVAQRLRNLTFELEPVDADVPLGELLRETAAQVLADRTPDWEIAGADPAGDPELLRLPAATLTQAVRIVREALLNARKHAGADHVEIAVEPDRDGIGFVVRDDGSGTPEPVSPPGHRGLKTMRERAELTGGWFHFESGPDGTTVRFWLPRNALWAGG